MVHMPPRLNNRLWTTAVIVCIAFGAAGWVLYRMSTTTVRPLNESIASMTEKLSADLQQEGFQRTPEKTEQGESKVAVLTDSLDHANSGFLIPNGRQSIGLHIAAWESLGKPTIPHPPNICYPANGYSIVDSQSVPINKPGEQELNARVLTVERDGVKLYVLFWYRWDRFVCTTRWEAIWARLSLIGQPEWPPVIKVMIETPYGEKPDESLKELTRFATEVNERTKKM